MHPKRTSEFQMFKARIEEISRSEPVVNLRDDVAESVLRFAQAVPRKFNPAVSVQKGKEDSLKGALTVAVAAVIYGAVKGTLDPALGSLGIELTAGAEQAFIGAITVGLGAAFHGLQAWFWNWRKHRFSK